LAKQNHKVLLVWTMWLALGAAAFGAVAIGALAIGRLAVGRLVIKKARFSALEVDELTVRRSPRPARSCPSAEHQI
jgi:hypothetical protein